MGTPSKSDGTVNLEYLTKAAESVAAYLREASILVLKSTVPIGTSKKIHEIVAKRTSKNFHLVSNPEFLKEGMAIDDFMRPDRVIIGSDDVFAQKKMKELYISFTRQGNPILYMSNLSAEMAKYAANAFLATKVSFINDIAKLCDLTGADIEEVREGIITDRRISRDFFYPGPGYGGSCLPKDVLALISLGKELETELKIIQAADEVNKLQKTYMVDKIKKYFGEDLSNHKFAFWGVAFKANTDDVRGSSAIDMAFELIKAGGQIHFYDPAASNNFIQALAKDSLFKDRVYPFDSAYNCLEGCDALITVTEWREFLNPNLDLIKKKLKKPVIFDARNIYSIKKIVSGGFDYFSFGKNNSNN